MGLTLMTFSLFLFSTDVVTPDLPGAITIEPSLLHMFSADEQQSLLIAKVRAWPSVTEHVAFIA